MIANIAASWACTLFSEDWTYSNSLVARRIVVRGAVLPRYDEVCRHFRLFGVIAHTFTTFQSHTHTRRHLYWATYCRAMMMNNVFRPASISHAREPQRGGTAPKHVCRGGPVEGGGRWIRIFQGEGESRRICEWNWTFDRLRRTDSLSPQRFLQCIAQLVCVYATSTHLSPSHTRTH